MPTHGISGGSGNSGSVNAYRLVIIIIFHSIYLVIYILFVWDVFLSLYVCIYCERERKRK